MSIRTSSATSRISSLGGCVLVVLWSFALASQGNAFWGVFSDNNVVSLPNKQQWSTQPKKAADNATCQVVDDIPRGGFRDKADVPAKTVSDAIATLQPDRLDAEAKGKKYAKYEYPLFQEGDGSDYDPDGIPARYVSMQKDNRVLARQAVLSTLRWRKENEIDSICRRPRPDFDIAKATFPHFFVGRDKQDHVIFVVRPALLDLDLAKTNKFKEDALLGM